MGQCERESLGHGRVREQHLVDLARGDLLASTVDDLFQAACDPEVAVLVHHSLVSGTEPTLRVSRGVGLRVVLIPCQDILAADGHLA